MILDALERAGRPLSDAELRLATGIGSHQTVNQTCRRLAERGVLERAAGFDGTILNRLAGGDLSGRSSVVLPANSAEQRKAEPIMLAQLSADLGVELRAARLSSPSGAVIDVDGVSPDRSVLAECWAHQGPAKVAQKWKLVNDAAKLQWAASWLDPRPQKLFLCVSDEAAVAHLRGKSWQRQAIESMGVEIRVIELPEHVAAEVAEAQRRQGDVSAYARRKATPAG